MINHEKSPIIIKAHQKLPNIMKSHHVKNFLFLMIFGDLIFIIFGDILPEMVSS